MYQIPSVNKGGPRPRQTSLPGVSRGRAGGGMQVCLQCRGPLASVVTGS